MTEKNVDKDELAFQSILLDYLIEEGYDETVNAFNYDSQVVSYLSNYKSITDKEILREKRDQIEKMIFSLV